MIIWISGLSGAGKTTLGEAIYKQMIPYKPNTVFIDGDNFSFVANFNINNPH